MIEISEYEYNLALFEVGSAVMEEQHGIEAANVMLRKKGCWWWLKTQQRCVDMEATRLIKERKLKGYEAIELYREQLREHLEGVYFTERNEKKLLIK